MGRYSIALVLALAASGWAKTALSTTETAADVHPAVALAAPREPIVGVGYHPGNFIGPPATSDIFKVFRRERFDPDQAS